MRFNYPLVCNQRPYRSYFTPMVQSYREKNMKIYFSGSKYNRKDFIPVYERISKLLEQQGHEVYSKILSKEVLSPLRTTAHKIQQWFEEWSSYIRDCDFALIEASYPYTIHIGFEIGMCLMRGKPVVVLYKEPYDPIFINPLYSPRLIKSEYTLSTLEESLQWCIDEIKNTVNRRFTFFISPEIDLFLDSVAKKDGLTRSEYIRGLIEEKMLIKR